jgi:hypothetical protein
MADNLHSVLSEFRDTMLAAVARLEFSLRDQQPPRYSTYNYVGNPNATWIPNSMASSAVNPQNDDDESSSVGSNEVFQTLMRHLETLTSRVATLERQGPVATAPSSASVLEVNDIHGILELQPPSGSRNIIVKTPAATPALAAAIAAANPPSLELHSNGDSATDTTEDHGPIENEPAEEGEVEEEDGDETPHLKQITYSGETYFIDIDHALYKETDEGYEEIGKWDATNKVAEFYAPEPAEEEEEVEEETEEAEEEAVEVEEFVYKGTTYQRDEENNVYLDGEHIGTWNGKKIVPLTG